MQTTPIREKDPRAQEAIRRWEELREDRAPCEGDWDECARLIRPGRGGHGSADPAAHRNEKAFSSAPIVAQEHFKAGLYGTLTNPANRWFVIESEDDELARWHPMAVWQDRVTSILLRSMQPDNATFYDASLQVFGDISTFGNSPSYDELVPDKRRILDVALSLAQVVVAIDGHGQVVEVVRRFMLSARQAARMFGLDTLPPKIRTQADKGAPDKLPYYHHTIENMDWQKGRLGPKGKRWLSRYVCEHDATLIRERGYAEMPFYFARWDVDTGQTYGRGPGMTALPDARVLNLQDAANLRAGQQAADPTLLAPDRDAWALSGVVRPGEVIYGGVNLQGQQLIRPLDVSSGTGLTVQMAERRIEHIRDCFHWSLMQMAGRSGMTATEIIERQEEKLRLMAPNMGRVQGEYLAPKVARRFALLWRAGQIPPPPPEASGTGLRIRYTSAAAMAQKSAEGASIVRFLQDVAPLVQMGRSRVLDRIQDDDLLEALHEARGTPARILRSRDEADAIGEARAQAEAQAAQMQQMAQGAQIAKDAAGAAQAAGMVEGRAQ